MCAWSRCGIARYDSYGMVRQSAIPMRGCNRLCTHVQTVSLTPSVCVCVCGVCLCVCCVCVLCVCCVCVCVCVTCADVAHSRASFTVVCFAPCPSASHGLLRRVISHRTTSISLLCSSLLSLLLLLFVVPFSIVCLTYLHLLCQCWIRLDLP